MTPGQLLKDARRRHHVTQRQLAARARTSQAQISRIERELISPSVATLANLLDVLGEELELESKPIDYGIDTTLYDSTLAREPIDRIRFSASFGNRVKEIHAGAVRPSSRTRAAR